MKKINNRGFILLETLVVSTFVISVLVFLYVQFSSIKRSYDESFKINSIPGLYGAIDLKKLLVSAGYDNLKTALDGSSLGYIDVSCSNINSNRAYCDELTSDLRVSNILFVKGNIGTLKDYLKNQDNVDTFVNSYTNGFYKYILKLESTSASNYRLLIRYSDDTYTSIGLD